MGFSTKVRNFLWERYLRIDTRVTLPGSKEDGGHYATINYHSIFKILKYLSPKPSDSLVDIGCGKGRVVCCAATAGFGRVAGAEFDQDLANAARGNIQRLRGGHAQANIIQGAAENLSYQDFSVHYHFNPFGAETLKKLLSKFIGPFTSPPKSKLIKK